MTADDSCHRKKLNGIFIYSLKLICAEFQLSSFPAQLKSVTPHRCTDVYTDAQTPGENSANSGPAWLVPGPELSNTIYFRRRPRGFRRKALKPYAGSLYPPPSSVGVGGDACPGVPARHYEGSPVVSVAAQVWDTYCLRHE